MEVKSKPPVLSCFGLWISWPSETFAIRHAMLHGVEKRTPKKSLAPLPRPMRATNLCFFALPSPHVGAGRDISIEMALTNTGDVLLLLLSILKTVLQGSAGARILTATKAVCPNTLMLLLPLQCYSAIYFLETTIYIYIYINCVQTSNTFCSP